MEEFILFFKLQKENNVKHNIMHFHSGEATLAGRLKQMENKKVENRQILRINEINKIAVSYREGRNQEKRGGLRKMTNS